ncbi:uncharacterized protein [Elaeis guineensis]|uniref:NAC domain-containing protein 35 isoform X2 n=1 Tax=Elaeis guineensis var. tenera TaxID=51953 RepID=A0A6I9S8N3_ELAGV|nr:NAC domain-containing protein 35 isoform X2 [Elaeis guineensis]
MCPSAPFSVPLDINASSTDEELVLFVGGRKFGDPVPDNVITEVSPFSVEPWNSPDMWYLYNPDDPQSLNGECEIKVTRTGYWKPMGGLRIFTSTPTVGRKTTREFYIGKAPNGDKTGWTMHEYQTEQKTHQGINKEQDHCSLYRVFFQINERPNHEEQHNSMIADAADGDYLEHVLLNLLEQENNSSSSGAGNRSQMVGRDQQGQSVLSGTSVTGPETDSSAEDVYATCDFSKGDYLELNDLYSPGTSSSSSDNSSLMSVNSDEYFDADALLRDLENEHNPRVEEEHADCRYSVSASVKSNQVVIRPPPSDAYVAQPFELPNILGLVIQQILFFELKTCHSLIALNAQFAVTVAVIWWQKGAHLPIQCLKGHGLPALPLLLMSYLITGRLLVQANLQVVIQTNLLPVVHVAAGLPEVRD